MSRGWHYAKMEKRDGDYLLTVERTHSCRGWIGMVGMFGVPASHLTDASDASCIHDDAVHAMRACEAWVERAKPMWALFAAHARPAGYVHSRNRRAA